MARQGFLRAELTNDLSGAYFAFPDPVQFCSNCTKATSWRGLHKEPNGRWECVDCTVQRMRIDPKYSKRVRVGEFETMDTLLKGVPEWRLMA